MTTSPDIRERSWSKTQSQLLNECKRKLYFHLNTHKTDVDNASIQTDILRLKNVASRALWTASILHSSIGDLLKTVRQGVPVPVVEDWILSVRDKMRKDFLSSRDNLDPHFRLFEHEYSKPVAPEVWRQEWALVEKRLRGFFESAWLQRFLSTGPECWKAVDDLFEFHLGETKLYAKIDCALEVDGRFLIVDWVQSRPKKYQERGLLLAALYAREVWGADMNQLDLFLVGLESGENRKVLVEEKTLNDLEGQINRESILLADFIQKQTNTLESLPFPQDTGLCLSCSYQKICYK